MIPQNDQKQVMAMDDVTANRPTTCRFAKRFPFVVPTAFLEPNSMRFVHGSRFDLCRIYSTSTWL
jgi:hypothetical protein